MQATATSNHSGASWGAILAGAACAAALSFILLILGFGLGLSSVSPWAGSGATIAVIGVSSIIWVAFTQIAASGLGGYVAGRLRVKWVDIQNPDEVFFRDTAHGLITWAVATLFAAALLGSTVSSILSGGAQAGATIAGGATSAAGSMAGGDDPESNYAIDALLRSSPAANGDQRADSEIRSELTSIVFRNLIEGELSAEDARYAAQLIANNTDLTPQQAQQRVSTVVSQARQTALEATEDARKSAATTALWMFVALLCGAFFASFMATVGGRQRDSVF